MWALTLHQPWASLIARGAKVVETRGWPAPGYVIGQRIAIHAARTADYLDLADEWPFCTHLDGGQELPRGAVVCTAVLQRCAQMTAEAIEQLGRDKPVEAALGLYRPGRYAWVLRDVTPFVEPVYVGSETRHQGVWEWVPGAGAQGVLL